MRRAWLAAGLFFATLATLLLETLDARLLSVLAWYHLSFLAVTLAMLGMAAGAVFVFLHPQRFTPERAPRALAHATFLFACSIPISHVMTLTIPFLPLTDGSTMEILSIAVSTVVLAAPFALAGVAVTVALTRSGGPIGRLYAFDLAGAALGCLLVVPLLELGNVSSGIFFTGAAAALSAACFYRFSGSRGGAAAVLALALVAVALLNARTQAPLQVLYPKNRLFWLAGATIDTTAWNSHSYVLVQKPVLEPAFLWGPGKGADRFKNRAAWIAIDGEAGTPITEWDGDPASLEWVSHDVTTLPYYLRHGAVAVIGIGGGRDVLAALWGRNPSIVGIDVNGIMIGLLTGSHREFAKIASRPEVTLVHDDGRAYLTRESRRFDVIQMSVVDTWAATGAGAFTLTENGLYTLDAWRVFLERLTPGGVLSVSRWFDPQNASETSRLLALAVAALLDRNVERPLDHLLLVVRHRIATLLVSTAPFSEADRAALAAVAREKEFQVAVTPWTGGALPLLDRIARSTTPEQLRAATADPLYDYSPPTDRRPYYFNMLKPQAVLHLDRLPRGGALNGNFRATLLLFVLGGLTSALVALFIVVPLVRSGRPPLPTGRFATSMGYFAMIGFAYMLIQIGFVQRFAVYLGHPTYTLAIVLFSMLLFTGLGSLLSERAALVAGGRFRFVPALIAAWLILTALALPGALARTGALGLPARSAIVLLFAAPLSVLLGTCFPWGVRLLRANPGLVPWAWGVNGAFGVLASIVAVATSIWIQIDANFLAAAGIYLALTAPLVAMARDDTRSAASDLSTDRSC